MLSNSLQNCFGAVSNLAENVFKAAKVSTQKLQDSEPDVCYMQAAGPLQPTPDVSCTVHSDSAAFTNQLARANNNSESFFI